MRTENTNIRTSSTIEMRRLRATLLAFLYIRLLFQFLFLKSGFGDGKEEGTIEAVLFTVLAYRGVGVREDITSRIPAKGSASPVE